MRQAAQQIIEHNKGFPSSVKDLMQLPGVGPYTAGAVSSIAFGLQSSIVDGNVIRVFSRLRAIRAPPNKPSALKLHWKLADSIVPWPLSGEFNQALMELGARICTPQNAKCGECPLVDECLARREIEQGRRPVGQMEEGKTCEECQLDDLEEIGRVERYPMKKTKKKSKLQLSVVLILESEDGKFVFLKNSKKGILANQWTFPSSEEFVGEEIELSCDGKIDTLRRKTVEMCKSLFNISAKSEGEIETKNLGSFVHVFSHIRRTVIVERILFPVLSSEFPDLCWKGVLELDSFALTTLMRKCVQKMTLVEPKKGKSKSIQGENKSRKRQRPISDFFVAKSSP